MLGPSDTARLPRQPLIRERLRRLFGEAWQRARRRRLRLLAVALVVLIAGAAIVAGHDNRGGAPADPQAATNRAITLHVSSSRIGRHQRIAVTITAQHSTGVFGKLRQGYLVQSLAVQPKVDCVNNRTGSFPDSVAGSRIHAVLDPSKGDGGPQGWCAGVYRGTVTYTRGFACPAQGRCNVPAGVVDRTVVVARFSYRAT